MSEHFRAFSFVDRIHSDEVGHRITGEYRVPEAVEAFPLSLVAESIGQLAAWSSMAALDFAHRPVAGIAGGVEFPGDVVEPGSTLQLEATLGRADDEAVGYDGVGSVDGEPVVRLRDCLGPMMPQEDFDDPEAVRGRYERLTGEGAEPGAFAGVPAIDWEKTGGEPGESAEGVFRVPEAAPFFGDHFPRRPVFPGTLLMDVNLRFVEALVAERPEPRRWRPTGTKNVKIRAFTPPGTELALAARIEEIDDDGAVVSVETRKGKRLTGGARVLLSPEK